MNPLNAQMQAFDQITQSFVKYIKAASYEKVYIQTDKPMYEPGDYIWMNAFLVNGMTNKASKLSDILYVELINPKGSLEKKICLQVYNGSAQGDFMISNNWSGGIYTIKAYTQWMQNFGQEVVFSKELTVTANVLPKLLMSLDFKRKAYSQGDEVEANLKLQTTEKTDLETNFDYVVQIDGKELLKNKSTTNNKGEATLKFKLPTELSSNDGIVNVMIAYKGNTESISRSVPIVLNKIDLQFLPEGGSFVNGIKSNMGFIAKNEFGKPADIEGTVYDQFGTKVADFRSHHDGMGAFLITPNKFSKCYAKLTKPAACKDSFFLPQISEQGCSFYKSLQSDNLIEITASSTEIQNAFLVCSSGEEVVFQKVIELQRNESKISIPTQDLPLGIVKITLFDAMTVPVCERLVYVNPHKKLNIEITTNKEKYSLRDPVEMSIKTTDQNGKAVKANISLAVVDEKLLSFADDKSDNILTYLTLSSELKGKINEPRYYLKTEDPGVALSIDFLLLTHGWRKFTWKEIFEDKFSMRYLPERLSFISGIVYDDKNVPAKNAVVTISVLDKDSDIAVIETDINGRFVYEDWDGTTALDIEAESRWAFKKNWKIVLDDPGKLSFIENGNGNGKQNLFNGIQNNNKTQKAVNGAVVDRDDNQNNDLGLGEFELADVVIIGYGSVKKNDLTGAISTIDSKEIKKINASGLDKLIQGRASGVTVMSTSGRPGAENTIRIRGVGSINKDCEPLYVVNGMVCGSINQISPNDITSIQILKDASATAIYGARGANGVVLISTLSGLARDRNYTPHTAIISMLPEKIRNLYVAKQFYSPVYKDNNVAVREDFRQTLYWNPSVVTNENGKANLSFFNSDEITSFKAIAEGISDEAGIGRGEYVFFSEKPFSMTVKSPEYATFDDEIMLPITLINKTQEEITGNLTFWMPHNFVTKSLPDTSQTIPAMGTKTVYAKFHVSNQEGKSKFIINFKGKSFSDAFETEILVAPKGFPKTISFSGQGSNQTYNIKIEDYVQGSISGKFVAYNTVVDEVFSGIDGLLREPYGCFEQTSSTTYPNLLVLDYLLKSGIENPQAIEKAKGLIEKGYKRLTGFETSQNGFEWFGSTPPHESLTAYGLLEFTEMRNIYAGVDDKMVQRTKEYLLASRDGKGGYSRSIEMIDAFGHASEEITNAYITYSLVMTGVTQLSSEIERTYKSAMQGKDMYCLALLANILLKTKDLRAKDVMQLICNQINKDGYGYLKASSSITCSGGSSLQVETASFILLAMLQDKNVYSTYIDSGIKYIIQNRNGYGSFPSTQATILALKAITEYTLTNTKVKEDGRVDLFLNNLLTDSKEFKSEQNGNIVLRKWADLLQKGEQKLQVKFKNEKSTLNHSFVVSYSVTTPESSPECPLILETKLNDVANQGETVRMNISISNKKDHGLPMCIAKIGIPSGLSLQPWQLKELQEKKVFDFYETDKNYLIIYYRGMAANDLKTINIDLKADIPGLYQAPASCAYLYYTNEYKNWTEGSKINIGIQ